MTGAILFHGTPDTPKRGCCFIDVICEAGASFYLCLFTVPSSRQKT